MLKLHNVRIEPLNVGKKSKETIQCDKRIVTCDIGTAQYKDRTVKCEKKKVKGTAQCEKITITCDVGTAQCEDGTIECEKKIREPPNVTKELSHVMLELHNMRMKLSNVRKK